ncbi:hypothetical protein CUN61_02865 [Pseudomonas arsenicoxydans]|uniref:Uncharacterized protein n=1 Tax=Pseudomonas arsenicoxydans TaxID=702115 RepID=A0A4P6FW42_9PSED|nr:hypothetical protein CUN61_02865 [Pseudomonas arsenicoxydans]
MIVPTLCVGMPLRTLRVRLGRDAERPGLHSHAERGNDQPRASSEGGALWYGYAIRTNRSAPPHPLAAGYPALCRYPAHSPTVACLRP